jgi:sulfonate dioxygenase
MQKYLESLTALHSAEEQANGSRALGRPVRREAVVTEHPLIRTHPVTGWKSLFYSPGFVNAIKGVPKMESDSIIRYLDEVIVATQEVHARYQWTPGMVALWDNRSCVSLETPQRSDITMILISRGNRTILRLMALHLTGGMR